MISQERLKKIELIVSDLDGTLLDNHGIIGKEIKKLIKLLQDKNVKFTFATQRVQSSIIEYAKELDLRTPLISLDGALIQNYPESVILFESFVPEKYVSKAIYLADRFLLKICLCHPEAIYYTSGNAGIPDLLDRYGALYKQIPSYENMTGRVLELIVAGDQINAIRYLTDRLSFPNSFGLDASYFISSLKENLYYLEVRKSGSSKGKGLKRLLKYFRLGYNQTAVIGDWYNDKSLFETRALKIAMANAVPDIKKMADYITKKTNDEQGIAEFLEMVLKYK